MNALDQLIARIAKLPGIGKKSAARIAYHLLKTDPQYVRDLAHDLMHLRERVRYCGVCGCFTEASPCDVCMDINRDRSVICVVEQPHDMLTIEATREYRGLYHVLMGVIAPLDGVGPEQLRITQLFERIRKDRISEIIIATNPTVEGDTTALYLLKLLKDASVRVTRLATGIPVGGDLEYADRLTLVRSLRGRTTF